MTTAKQRKIILVGILFLITIVRFFHFEGTIDLPHNWRQYDTNQYIDGYYYNDAPFMEPTVCWMGGHKTLVLEFPLPEYLVAKLYSVFGPHLWVARTFFLLFFVLAAYYFYKVLRVIFEDNWVPELATIVFGFAPLSLFYSRAIHIDFFALAFAFGMLYYVLIAVRDKSWKSLMWAVVFSIIAFLEKAPYTFYLLFPALVYILQQKSFKWFLPRSLLFVIPVIALYWWNSYSRTTNELIPDWYFIPSFNKFTDMWYWYFGTWEQRTNSANWITILERLRFEILGLSGIALLIVGLVFTKKNRAYWWSLSWLIGTILYVCIFFNLNVHHNYYQMPFIASLAIFVAMGVQRLIDFLPKKAIKMTVAIVLPAIFVVESMRYAETNYYTTEPMFDKIALEIKKHSKPDDLVIVSFGGLTPQCPLILQPANRYGWSIPGTNLNTFLIRNLVKEGKATRLAVVYDGYFTGEFQLFFEGMENKVGVPLDDKGKALYMCDLK